MTQPRRNTLRFHTGDAVEHCDASIQYAQTTLHFDRKVDVTRRVDQTDDAVLPGKGDGRTLDGDAAIALFLQKVSNLG